MPLAICPFPIGELGPFALFPVILVEVLACYLIQRCREDFALVLIGVLWANCAALLVGYVALALIPPAGAFPHGLTAASFLISFVLSVAIEHRVCVSTKLGRMMPRLLLTFVVANVAGYSLLGFLLWRFGLETGR